MQRLFEKYALLSVTNSLSAHLFVAPDLQESTCRMKGSSATCVDMSSIIIVQDTNKIGTLSLIYWERGTKCRSY